MAMSLFDKAKLVVQSQLHELLDREVNTPEGFKQLIRNLETAQGQLRAGRDEAAGTANGYKRHIEEWTAEIVDKQGDIDLLLGDNDPSNDQSALQLQLDVQTLQGQIDEYEVMLADQQQQVQEIDTALDQLERKRQKMLIDYRRLTTTRASTQAKNRAAQALENASDVAGSIGSVDSIQANLQHENDVASARFDRVVGEMSTNQSPEEAANLARAKAALDQRRAELANKAAGDAADVPPTS